MLAAKKRRRGPPPTKLVAAARAGPSNAGMPAALLEQALVPSRVATATRGTLRNLANLPRTSWVPLALPGAHALNTAVEATFLTDRGLRLRAVRCEGVGPHSMMWRVLSPLDAAQSIDGSFVDPVAAPSPD